MPRCDDEPVPDHIEFFFDPICPWAYQTSVWIRDVRSQIGLDIRWRFFSLEEINRPAGKRHPWERPIAYGWTPMRVAAWLRRTDMGLCDRWYEACGQALHVDGRRFYEREVALDLLDSIGAPQTAWDDAAVIDDIVASETGLCFGPDTLVEARNRGYALARPGANRRQRKPRA